MTAIKYQKFQMVVCERDILEGTRLCDSSCQEIATQSCANLMTYLLSSFWEATAGVYLHFLQMKCQLIR